MYLINFYVPESHLDLVKQAMFNAGAGQVGEYSECCWQCLGQGQFKPSTLANPHIGTKEKVETVAEYKVEMVCTDDLIKTAVAALKQAHPYEEVAFQVFPCHTVE